jgi:putative ABC transport system substrate-binding protein
VIARRRLLAGLAGMLLAARGSAQPAKRRIAFFYFASRQAAMDSGRYQAFIQGLREAGLVDGRDVEIVPRFAEGVAERVPTIAAELLRDKVDVIVASGSQVSQALRDARTPIPVVVTVGADPVGGGLAASIGRPGGAFTGLTDGAESLLPKQLELVRSAVPRLACIGTIVVPSNDGHRLQMRRLAALARDARLRFASTECGSDAAIAPAFAAMTREKVDALILFGDTYFTQSMAAIARAAIDARMPTVYITPQFPEAGGLMSYGPDLTGNFRRAAFFVDRILKGAKPGDLPFEHPSTYHLVVNLRTAKALGLALPASLAARADRVIE